ncbi:SPOR domain-containing protein [Cognatishimia activa]|uniref:SPOR domain-containing protein n=1 Tax=Cognatishimia activa TaxID=1715691 RepID=UPI002231C813|nr:SPOR domain-containing protein [Cognatishimia activa]UZD92223.1 SPOR domain-containing protein [Cognatishimia activa]
MAQIPMNGSAPQAGSPQIVGSLANWAGAVVSLGLILGAGVWGYKLLVRDVTGVPVVRAIEGPMREQPVDPGGQQAAHQGLAVNSVAAEGTAAAPADRLVLAPPPIQLNDTDEPAAGTDVAVTAPPVSEETTVAAAPEAISAPPPIQPGDVDALVNQIVADATPLTELEPVAEPKPEAAVAVVKEGLGTSLRPKLRPSQFSAPAPVEVVASVSVDVAPETLPAGTRLVQLGAYASPDIARAEWDKLQTKFGDYLGDKKRVVQKATSGGRTFYRLRAMGFADLSDARRLCSALKAENADCIPVVTR